MNLVRHYVAIVLFAPLLWGAVYLWTVSVWLLAFGVLAMRLPSKWFGGPRFTVLSLYTVMFAFIVVVILQILPNALSLMPNSIWELSAEALGTDISARTATDLSALIGELGIVALYVLAFWTALAIGSDHHRAVAFLQWAVWGTAVLVGITLAIYFVDDRFLLWQQRVHYIGDFTHGFVNRNTAASYLGTFTLVSFGLLARSWRSFRISGSQLNPDMFDEALPNMVKQIVPNMMAIAIFAEGLFLTSSRAGILFSGVSLIFLMALFFIKSNSGLISKMFGVVIMLSLSVWIFANWGEKVSGRLDVQGLELTDRGEVYSATLQMIKDYPVLGVGLGDFASTFPAYRPLVLSPRGFWDKAHNTYLEIIVEMGIPFSILLAVFWIGIFIVLLQGFITRQKRYILPAIGASVWLLASLHSLVDFSLQIPGHGIAVAAILGGCIAQTVRNKR